MAKKRKPDSLNRQGSPSKSGSKLHAHHTKFSIKNQLSLAFEDHEKRPLNKLMVLCKVSRRMLKTFQVQFTCWGALPATLAVLFSGGLRHD